MSPFITSRVHIFTPPPTFQKTNQSVALKKTSSADRSLKLHSFFFVGFPHPVLSTILKLIMHGLALHLFQGSATSEAAKQSASCIRFWPPAAWPEAVSQEPTLISHSHLSLRFFFGVWDWRREPGSYRGSLRPCAPPADLPSQSMHFAPSFRRGPHQDIIYETEVSLCIWFSFSTSMHLSCSRKGILWKSASPAMLYIAPSRSRTQRCLPNLALDRDSHCPRTHSSLCCCFLALFLKLQR